MILPRNVVWGVKLTGGFFFTWQMIEMNITQSVALHIKDSKFCHQMRFESPKCAQIALVAAAIGVNFCKAARLQPTFQTPRLSGFWAPQLFATRNAYYEAVFCGVPKRNDSKWHSWQSDHQFRWNPAIEAVSGTTTWIDAFGCMVQASVSRAAYKHGAD